MKSLHDKIINTMCEPVESNHDRRMAYKEGHRDARHAAAELATEHDALMGELLEALEEIVNDDIWAKDAPYLIRAKKAIAKAKGEVK